MAKRSEIKPEQIKNNIMAVMDGAPRGMGAMVWWTLSAVDPAELRAAWEAEGLDVDMLPTTPLPQVALGRACRQLAEQRRLVRPLEKRKGYSLVAEKAEGQTLAYSQQVNVSVNPLGGLQIEPPTHELADTIRDEYARALDTLNVDDISELLRCCVSSLRAVSLRNTGGIYFVPPSRVQEWGKISRAFRAASKVLCWEVPAMKSDGAVEAITNAVKDEANNVTRDLEQVLDEGTAGERALRNRISECEATEQKISEYEAFLGQKMEAVTAALQALRARLTEAAMQAAEAAKEEA